MTEVPSTGRNNPCPCGSGVKYKRCHGTLMADAPTAEQSDMQKLLFQRAAAAQFDRILQQGQGRPIISEVYREKRFVAVGGNLFYGKWKTFHDFLFGYVLFRLGHEWIAEEKAKPEEERHRFVQWMNVYKDLLTVYIVAPGQLNQMPFFGAARAVVGLAYDLYLAEHYCTTSDDKNQFGRMLDRLRQNDQFFGARHELRAAGMLLRAGFELVWEKDQQRQRGGHGEFIATYPSTNRSFWVECKMRQPQNEEGPEIFTHLVSQALKKVTTLERLIFVELNLRKGQLEPDGNGWPGMAINQLRQLEQQQASAQLPSALIVLSNLPDHRYLRDMVKSAAVVLEGFNTKVYRFEFSELWDVIQEREENPEIESLMRTAHEHSDIPSTFDGSMLEPRRYEIGKTYTLPDGNTGVLEDGMVLETEGRAFLTLRMPQGQHIIGKVALSAAELSIWRQSPETFFGVLKSHFPPAKSEIDLFDFFLRGYEQTPKERLLELLGQSVGEDLQGLPQPELVKRYAYALTSAALQQGGEPRCPEWYYRLRRQPKR